MSARKGTPDGRKVARRYPLAPLIAAVDLTSSVPRALGVSGSTWQEYRDHGVSERVADRLAHRLGVGTYDVWPEMIDHAIEDASRPCAHCGGGFVPERWNARYCTFVCKRRAANARQYARYGEQIRARQRVNDRAAARAAAERDARRGLHSEAS